MKRLRLLVLAATTLALAAIAVPSVAQDTASTICSNLASVSWDVDLETITVSGATVEVLGCDDGELVGLELITTDGDLPAGGPRGAEVADGRAVFDLTDLEVRVEPVIGVRVYLIIDEDTPPIPFLNVVIEQRFFNQAGNEQFGLREDTRLNIAPRSSYFVPTASAGYVDVACDEVNAQLPGDVLNRSDVLGSGTFDVTGPGTHVACYQQTPGAPGGPGPGGPGAEPPAVLDDVTDLDDVDTDTAVLGDGGSERPDDGDGAAAGRGRDGGTSVLGQVLSRTGADAMTLSFIGLVMLAIGARLVLHRRRMQQV